jgi:eukaryotic-like serine/threonine-protein kinase
MSKETPCERSPSRCHPPSPPASLPRPCRSLRSAHHAHQDLFADAGLADRIDRVLAEGASQRLPNAAWRAASVGPYQKEARSYFPGMFVGPERFATAEAFGEALLPLLERCAATATTVQSTKLILESGAVEPLATITEIAWMDRPRADRAGRSGEVLEPLTPGNAVFQPDGTVLARFGGRLLYLASDGPRRVGVPAERAPTVAASRWLVRGPTGGFALVGPSHVLLLRSRKVAPTALPARPSGGKVGEVQAAIGTGEIFGVVTAETEESNGGPELWVSRDGASWMPPVVLPLRGQVHGLSCGPTDSSSSVLSAGGGSATARGHRLHGGGSMGARRGGERGAYPDARRRRVEDDDPEDVAGSPDLSALAFGVLALARIPSARCRTCPAC